MFLYLIYLIHHKHFLYIHKILLFHLCHLILLLTNLFILLLFLIDYISVKNIKQAPRFSIVKVSSENAIYYDTLFYDVVRCNKDTDNEYYEIIKNNNYDKNNIEKD